jgi:hypothetical protein
VQGYEGEISKLGGGFSAWTSRELTSFTATVRTRGTAWEYRNEGASDQGNTVFQGAESERSSDQATQHAKSQEPGLICPLTPWTPVCVVRAQVLKSDVAAATDLLGKIITVG